VILTSLCRNLLFRTIIRSGWHREISKSRRSLAGRAIVGSKTLLDALHVVFPSKKASFPHDALIFFTLESGDFKTLSYAIGSSLKISSFRIDVVNGALSEFGLVTLSPSVSRFSPVSDPAELHNPNFICAD
jgi:hypothetical protein